MAAGDLSRAFRRHGIELPPAAVQAQRGRHKLDAIVRLLELHGGSGAASNIGKEALAGLIHEVFLADVESQLHHLREVEGATSALRFLRSRGLRIAFESGFPSGVAEALVARAGWRRAGLVDFVATPAEDEPGRPDPTVLRRVMRELGVEDPGAVVKVGDTVVDVEEGRNAGVWTLAVLTGSHSREELERARPDHVLGSVAELPALFTPAPPAGP